MCTQLVSSPTSGLWSGVFLEPPVDLMPRSVSSRPVQNRFVSEGDWGRARRSTEQYGGIAKSSSRGARDGKGVGETERDGRRAVVPWWPLASALVGLVGGVEQEELSCGSCKKRHRRRRPQLGGWPSPITEGRAHRAARSATGWGPRGRTTVDGIGVHRLHLFKQQASEYLRLSLCCCQALDVATSDHIHYFFRIHKFCYIFKNNSKFGCNLCILRNKAACISERRK